MFNLFRRKKIEGRRRDVISPWIKLIVLVFILYAVTVSSDHKKAEQQAAGLSRNPAESLATAKQTLSQYTNRLMPVGVALRVEDVAAGTGHPVICGQDILLTYDAYHGENAPAIDSASKDKPYRLRIGAGDGMPALEQGIIGMQIGGKRSIFARNTLAYASRDASLHPDIPADATLRFNVEILSASPDFSALDSTLFRIADTQIGGNSTFICGAPATVLVTVWSAEGKKLFETKEPISFTPGKSEVFLGLEQGIIGMKRGGARTLIVPPSMQKPMHGGKPVQAFALPQSQAVIVDVLAVR